MDIAQGMEDSEHREFISEYVAGIFEGTNDTNSQEAWLNDLDETYKPEFYWLKTYDLAGKVCSSPSCLTVY